MNEISPSMVLGMANEILKLRDENAHLREELQRLRKKEKPIRFSSLADWRRE